MKANKFLMAGGILLLLFAISNCWPSRGDYTFHDLGLRYNESLLSHKLINPFKVWDREISVEGFYPHPRPDRADVQPGPSDLKVHAYPAYHNIWTWWYGWLPWNGVLAISMAINLLVMISAVFWLFNRIKCGSLQNVTVLVVCSYIAINALGCISVGQYGIFALGILLLLMRALERKNDTWAGILLALMCIKPQIGALFFIPLLFTRKWKVVCVASFVLMASTSVMAIIYRESPIELILEIPKIGLPYVNATKTKQLLSAVLYSIGGNIATTTWTFACIAMAAWLSWRLRLAKSWGVRLLPAISFLPFWTYYSTSDWVVFLPAFALLLNALPEKTARLFLAEIAGVVFFIVAWTWACSLNIFSPTGIGFIYRIAEFMIPCSIAWLTFRYAADLQEYEIVV